MSQAQQHSTFLIISCPALFSLLGSYIFYSNGFRSFAAVAQAAAIQRKSFEELITKLSTNSTVGHFNQIGALLMVTFSKIQNFPLRCHFKFYVHFMHEF